MEARKITIVSTKNQKKSVIMSNATTLAELKRDMRNNGIDYNGMTFFEGTSKTELKIDESILPHDVPFKGQTTNELVFMLTNPDKKIRSGATITTRKEAGAFFKANPDKATEFRKAHGGKNWTNCSTTDILKFINKKTSAPKTAPVVEQKEEVKAPKAETPKAPKTSKAEVSDDSVKKAMELLVSYLADEDYISSTQKETIKSVLNGGEAPEVLESDYSDDDIDAMFAGMR